jgi:hypothetical protein
MKTIEIIALLFAIATIIFFILGAVYYVPFWILSLLSMAGVFACAFAQQTDDLKY